MKKSITLLALSTVAAYACAGSGLYNPIQFQNIPGVQEFTGTMIVKPLSIEKLQRLGKNQIQAEAVRRNAEVLINADTVNYIPVLDFYTVRLTKGETEMQFAKRLRETGMYELIEPNYRVFPAFTPNDPQLGLQWSHTNNQSTEAWDIMRGSSNVTIAITDTGVHKFHEDFLNPQSRFVPGYNAMTGVTEANGATVQDTNGHGTHCAGIAAAWGNNSRGVAGVNIEGARIMPVKIDQGGGTTFEILTGGALWAAQNGAKVISTSYSGVTFATIGTTGDTIRNNYGALWFYAAGNEGANRGAAADWPNVTIIGNLQSNNTRNSGSSYGNMIDCFAPGTSIRSTFWTNDGQTATYADLTGTSMATPYAAGVAAMIWGSNPNLSAERVETILERTCIFTGTPSTFGWGRTNLWNAMGRKPNNLSILRGIQVGGDVRSLDRVENTVLDVAKGITVNQAEAPVQIVTEHNASFDSNFGELYVTVTAKVNVTGVLRQRVQLFNFTTNQYDTVNEGTIGTSYGVFEASQTSNVANYISGGIVRVRTQVFPAGPVSSNNWRTQFDQVNVRTLRADEAS
ncbi:MAG: S8 family serine peptidase [Fimbriimonadaceae bacterium]|nr:S8 family serine peptidase [Fimbriimonadaceae bacterium]QYK55367.1 MAG: S8 family serine peptidase [Fimbriimonadaceae bacterium]